MQPGFQDGRVKRLEESARTKPTRIASPTAFMIFIYNLHYLHLKNFGFILTFKAMLFIATGRIRVTGIVVSIIPVALRCPA